MVDARHALAADAVVRPAQQRAVVHLRVRRVRDRGARARARDIRV